MTHNRLKLVQCDLVGPGCRQTYEYNGKTTYGAIFHFARYTKEDMRYFRFRKDGSPEWLDWFELEYFGGRITGVNFVFDYIEVDDGQVIEALYDKL